MSFTRTNFKDFETIITADFLNNLQNEVVRLGATAAMLDPLTGSALIEEGNWSGNIYDGQYDNDDLLGTYTGHYKKMGRVVMVDLRAAGPTPKHEDSTQITGDNIFITGLPFPMSTSQYDGGAGWDSIQPRWITGQWTYGFMLTMHGAPGLSVISSGAIYAVHEYESGEGLVAANIVDSLNAAMPYKSYFYFSGIYYTE